MCVVASVAIWGCADGGRGSVPPQVEVQVSVDVDEEQLNVHWVLTNRTHRPIWVVDPADDANDLVTPSVCIVPDGSVGFVYGRMKDGEHRPFWNPDYYRMGIRKCHPRESIKGSVSVDLPLSGRNPGPGNPYLWSLDEGAFAREYRVTAVESLWVAFQYWICDPQAADEEAAKKWVRTGYARAIIKGERSYGISWDTGERLAVSENKEIRIPLEKPVVISVPDEGSDDPGLWEVPSGPAEQ